MRHGGEVGAQHIPALRVLRQGLAASPELRRGAALTLALAMVAGGGRVVTPVLVQQTIDRHVTGGTARLQGMLLLAGAGLALILVAAWAARTTSQRLATASERALCGLRVRAFNHIHALSMAHHTTEQRGALVSRVTSDVETLGQFFRWGGLAWVINSALMLAALVAMLLYDWRLALVAVATVLPLVAVLRVMQRRVVVAWDAVRTRVGESLAAISESIQGAAVIRAYGVQAPAQRRVLRTVEARRQAEVRAGTIGAFFFPSGELFGVGATAAVLLAGMAIGPSGGLTAGTLVAFAFLVTIFLEPVAEFTEILDMTQQAVAGWKKVLDVLDTPVEVEDPRPGLALPARALDIELQRVSFAYHGGPPVLVDVSVAIPAGTRVALVGTTGSGKTTLAKLLIRLADPTAGTIRVAGVDLRQVSLASLRSALVMVPQDGFLFDTSVAENVRMGRPDAGDREVQAAFEALELGRWVDGLPRGVHTRVGERGDYLSVGERQLVALARGYLADPGCLILDEATSAVDPATEVALRNAIKRLTEGRTALTIAHRLATAEHADLILVLERGRLVQQGTHGQLLADPDGAYARLHGSWMASLTAGGVSGRVEGMLPADLAHLRTPSAPTLTPDGRLVAVAVGRIDLEADQYRAELWLAPTDGSAPPRRFTSGRRDVRPRFSPDGRWLAFLRAADDDKPQLHVMATDGGEARRVCEHPLGVEGFAWSPDSTRIAYAARVPEEGRYGTGKDIPPEKEPPRRITTFRYRTDNLGFTFDRRRHVFVVDALAEGAEPVQVTRGDYDHADPAWSPDGASVAFVSARHETRDEDAASDVFVAPAAGGDAVRVTATDLSVARPAFSPDGATIWFVASEPDLAGRPNVLWSVPADGSGKPERLTDPERFDHDPAFGAGILPLLVDEEAVTTITLDRGAVRLLRFPVGGGEPTELLGGRRVVHDYAAAGGVVAAVVSHPLSAGEVAVVEDGQERTLTDFGAELARSASLRPMEELETTAPDGYGVHGWVVKPAGTGPFPVLLMVHGGPFAHYGWTLFDEAQVYAGAGYAVVMGNPRGSAGYGEAHGRAVVGDFGNRDSQDLLALLDAALEDPDLDGDRTGVMGGSYGGFMTTWLVGHTDRFKAAISERACNAFDSFEGSSDIGWFFVPQYIGNDPERIGAQSPLAHADRIRTPMLLIHSEQDWRCPIEQAQRLFVALKKRKVSVELLLFPGEGHELTRSGLPSHRVARFEAVLDWWGRHLTPSG